MNLTMKQPAWAAALWMLLLTRCNDGPTSAAAAATAAFVPQCRQTSSTLRAVAGGNRNKRERTVSMHSSSLTDSDLKDTTTASTTTTVENNPHPVAPVTRIHLPHDNKQAWSQLVPAVSLLRDQERGIDDSRIEWSPDDDYDLNEVARKLLQPFAVSKYHEEMVNYVADCMRTFHDFCSENLKVAVEGQEPSSSEHANAIQGFRARIVCSRGGSGTKCPKWHVDHIPVRWIQSLVGPGCDYIESKDTSIEEWHRVKYHLENDQPDQVFDIPGPSHLLGHQANEQQAMLLAGNRWNEFAKQPHPFVPPVLHKSPNIPFWQGRILLTMDVIVPHHHD